MRRAFKEASIAALPHTYCVILNKLLHVSGPWMPHLGSRSLWCCLCSVAMRIKRTNSYTVLRRVSDIVFFVVVQSLSHVCLVVTPWTAARQAPLSSAVSQSLLKFMSIESLMLYNHLILCCCLLFLPSVFPSIRVFANELPLCMRWPKYWSFSFNISPSNEHSGLISFGWTGWISLESKGFLRVFFNTTVQKHQFFGAQASSQSNSHIHT